MSKKSRYILHKRVARGGMAEIYLGLQTGEDGFQRICCIKRILPHFANEPEFIEMFRDEAHICKGLQHANIVRVEGFEEVENSYAIVMEFISGGDLRGVLAACEKSGLKLSVPMALHIIAEAARGLHYAHCKKDELTDKPLEIVHRDISPQNILISFEGEVKVTDFGIADADDKGTETKPGIVKGKYSYMSPEQINAETVDARTDVFALVIVLWEMLAMERLFFGDNEVITIQKVRACEVEKDLRSLNFDVDNELFAIIQKGLSKHPEDRFSSAAELEKILRRHLNNNYAEFTVSDLSAFMKKIMSTRLEEMKNDIKELLSVGRSSSQIEEQTVIVSKNIDFNDFDTPSFEIKTENKKVPFSSTKLSKASTSINKNLKNTSNTVAKERTNSSAAKKNPIKYEQLNRASYNSLDTIPSRQKKKSGSKNSSGLLAILFILISAIAYVLYKKNILQSNNKVTISTTPLRIQAEFNQQPLFEGFHVKFPLVFELKNNKVLFLSSDGQKDSKSIGNENELNFLFKRRGFRDENFSINKEFKGEKFIVLDKLVDMAPIRIRSKDKSAQLWVMIDHGEFSAKLSGNKELDAEDITFGEKHTIFVYKNNFKQNEAVFSCTFVPRAQNWGAPYYIDISIKNKSCHYPPR